MKIKVINPNTSSAVTKGIATSARRVAGPSTEVLMAQPEIGPESIESSYGEYLSIPGVLSEVAASGEDIDAFVIACFGDPGLQAARELTASPVLGIAETSLYLASMLAPRFSVLSTLARDKVNIENLIRSYGMEYRIASIRPVPLGVLDFERMPEKGMEVLQEESSRAVEEDQAEAIILGCAGMVDCAVQLEDGLGLPVIDGITVAMKFAESVVELGKNTSKINTYKLPRYTNL